MLSATTATYSAIHSYDGDLIAAIADTTVLSSITSDIITKLSYLIEKSNIVVVDGNLCPETFSTLINICNNCNIPVFFEPTSDVKCILPITTNTLQSVRTVRRYSTIVISYFIDFYMDLILVAN